MPNEAQVRPMLQGGLPAIQNPDKTDQPSAAFAQSQDDISDSGFLIPAETGTWQSFLG